MMHLNSPKKSNSLKTNVQLIEESLHSCTTFGVENLVSNGINYLSTQDSFHQPYLRSPTYFFSHLIVFYLGGLSFMDTPGIDWGVNFLLEKELP